MTRLYPITKTSPASATTQEKTSLPFGFVVQPFATFRQIQSTRRNNSRPGNNSNVKSEVKPIKSYLVAKCTRCGAPLNPGSYFTSRLTVLCPFCGRDFPVDYDSQLRYQGYKDESSSINYHSRKEKYIERLRRIRGLGTNTAEYEMPLFATASPSQQRHEIFSLPVAMCPPIITVLIDGTSKDPKYYSKICSSLQYLLDCGISASSDSMHGKCDKRDFKGRRLGIFIMGPEGNLSVFDLKSPNAHLKHIGVNFPSSLRRNPKFSKKKDYTNAAKNSVIPLSDILDIENVYVQLDSDYSRSCIDSAMRVLADTTILNQTCLRSDTEVVGETYLGSTIRYILDCFDDVAYHPGMYQNELNQANHNNFTDGYNWDGYAPQKFLYSGGKIMCFLAGPPKEIGTKFSSGQIGSGGFGGSCAEIGKRFGPLEGPTNNFQNIVYGGDDVEVGRSQFQKEKTSPFATDSLPQTAYSNVHEYYQDLGIDCSYYAHSVEIFGLVNQTDDENGIHLGFNYLRLLNDRSGGNGPIVVSLSGDNAHDDILEKEVLSRSTLTRPTAFGSRLKVRMTQSLEIKKVTNDYFTKTSDQKNDTKYPDKMIQYIRNNGMYGPVSSINDDDNLFFMGTCDVSTTLSFDLQFTSGSTIVSDYEIERNIKPCIQFCFAYTTTIKSEVDMIVVRRLRVVNFNLDSSDTPEAVTSSLDTEALAVSIKEFAGNWLMNVLLACYRSAEDVKQKIDKYGGDAYHPENFEFYPKHRLINDNSEFTKNEIVLGQGHHEIQHLPLLLYCLIQCDGLRPCSGSFNPSVDARCAALVSMSSMSPSALSRCIAPRLELWKGGIDTKEASVDFLNLNLKDIIYDIDSRIGDSALLFLDSPRQLILYDCIGIGAKNGLESENDIPERLGVAMMEALESYRVPPSHIIALGDDNLVMAHLQDALIEDSTLQGQTYQGWLDQISGLLHQELEHS